MTWAHGIVENGEHVAYPDHDAGTRGALEGAPEIPYTWNFYTHQSPVRLQYVARLNGIELPPIAEPFTYCELGCGNGVTANILADSLPQGSFYAVDINPAHIANAESMAKEAGLSNITFFQDGFGGMLQRRLPKFDYITLHGVWSWVDDGVRREALAVIDKFLKPGGLVYVSYNCLPGWAPLIPVWRMMQTKMASADGDALNKARAGLAYLKRLLDGDAPYFKKNPAAGKYVSRLLRRDTVRVVHALGTNAFEPMYFGDVAKDMASIGLSYCGSAKIEKNHVDLTTPSRFIDLIEDAAGPIDREMERSVITNEKFRRDVYCRGRAPIDPDARYKLYADTVVGGTVDASEVTREFELTRRNLRLSDKIYDALIPALVAGRCSISEVCALPSMTGYGARQITEAIHRLILGGQFEPFAAPAPEFGTPARFRIASTLNRLLLEKRLIEDGQCYLASPVLGRGLRVNLIRGLLLLAGDAVGLDRAAEYVVSALEAAGSDWPGGRKGSAAPGSRRAKIETELAEFRVRWLPLLLRFGIVEPAPESARR